MKLCHTLAVNLLFLAGLVGCEGSKPWEQTHPVVGKLVLKGKPVVDAELIFYPEDDSYPTEVRPRAKSGSDGTFSVWTYQQGDGAPVGKYKVTVIRNAVAVSKDTVVARPNDLPKKYSSLDTTDVEVTLQAGKNPSLDIELRYRC